jgi:hypothetical protein
VVLDHLRQFGAHSLDELAGSPPEILGLQLSRAELEATLESARRRRLIERLDAGSGSGRIEPADEWILTDAGWSMLHHGASRLMRLAGDGWKFLATAVLPLGAFLGLKMEVNNWDWAFGAFALLVASIIVWATVAIRRRAIGARPGKTLAVDWVRWSLDRRELYEHAVRPFPWLWLLATVGAQLAAIIAMGALGLESTAWELFVLALAALPAIPIVNWLSRWSDIAIEAKQARIREALAASSLATS